MIQDIVTAINDRIRDCLSIENAIYYGVSQTIEVNNERYPVTRGENAKLVKICLDDKIDLKVYHKIAGEVRFNPNKDLSFGTIIKYNMEARMRMVVILKSEINLISPSYNPLNFGRVIPYRVEVEEYKSIQNIFNSVSTDHDAIVAREWKRNDYSKHKCKFFVFDVNYTIRAVTCDLDCGSFLLLEDDYKVLPEDGSFILL
jgi:hypothetical protein